MHVNATKLTTQAVLLSWALLVICPTSGAGPAAQEDGVEVVFSPRPRWTDAEGWRLSASPELVIGENTADSPYVFARVFSFTPPRGGGHGRGPFRLPNGEIVVGELRSANVMFFDASGRLMHSAVGVGGGPTELRVLSELLHCVPGKLVVFDDPRGVLGVLDSAGEFQDRLFFEANAGREMRVPLSCNRNGQFLAMDSRESEIGDRLQDKQIVSYRKRLHIRLLDREGHQIRDLGEFPGVDWVEDVMADGGRRSMPHPFGKTTAYALGTDRAFIGTADDFEIQVWSLDGVLEQRWQRPVGDLTIREDDVAAYESVDPAVAAYLQTIWGHHSSVPMPDTYPAYTRFILDATDHLWVEHFRTPRDTRHLWSVFAPDGVWLGEVEVPYTFEITEIGEDYVLGVYRDELDDQSVRMYGLSRE